MVAGVTPACSAMVSDAVPSKPPSAKQSTAASRMRSLVSSLLVFGGRPGLRFGRTAITTPSPAEGRWRRPAAFGGVGVDGLADGVDGGVHEAVIGADDPVVRRLRGLQLALEVRHHVLGE